MTVFVKGKTVSPEQRAELEAFDKETEDLWLEQVEESIKENKVINNLILRIITGEDYWFLENYHVLN